MPDVTSTHPTADSPAKAVLGVLGLVALGAVPLWWAVSEPRTGERVLLLAIGGLMMLLAAWRAVSAVAAARRVRRLRRR